MLESVDEPVKAPRPAIRIGVYILSCGLMLIGAALAFTNSQAVAFHVARHWMPLLAWGLSQVAVGTMVPLVFSKRWWKLGLLATGISAFIVLFFAYVAVISAAVAAQGGWILGAALSIPAALCVAIAVLTIGEHKVTTKGHRCGT